MITKSQCKEHRSALCQQRYYGYIRATIKINSPKMVDGRTDLTLKEYILVLARIAANKYMLGPTAINSIGTTLARSFGLNYDYP